MLSPHRLSPTPYGTNWRGHFGSAVWVVRHPGGFEPQSDRGPLHFHMLVLDGVYVKNDYEGLRFHRVNAPNVDELKALVHAISHRVADSWIKEGSSSAMPTTAWMQEIEHQK
jgi:hypothetical protein